MIGDAAIHELVQGHQRGERTLESILLGKCFGLSGACLKSIGRYCRKLKHLDLSYGSAVSNDQYLMYLVLNSPAKESTSTEDTRTTSSSSNTDLMDLSPLVRSLETINLSNGDFLTEATLSRFLSVLTCLPPSKTRLQLINLSNTFCVNESVLSSIYNPSIMKCDEYINKLPPSDPICSRTFALDVTNCDQINRAHLTELLNRLVLLQSQQLHFGPTYWISSPHIIENCKLMDESITAIRSYLQTLFDAPVV